MRVVSINTGKIQTYLWHKGTDSAILKTPVEGPIHLSKMGFEGDETADKENHGGPDKALLMMPSKTYVLFNIQKPYGFLGDTLTIAGGDETSICLGDRFQVGDAVIEVSQPRMPCFKLNGITNNEKFMQRYSESGHVGIYCRVIKEGDMVSGILMTPLVSKHDLPRITIKDLFMARHHRMTRTDHVDKDVALLKLAIKHPALSEAWREEITALLKRGRGGFDTKE